MKSSAAAGDSCRVHLSSPLPAFDQVHGLGYIESEVETNAGALQLESFMAGLELETSVAGLELEMDAVGPELETNAAALELETSLDLEMETDMPQGLSKHERYSAD
jgi:hypothetical protein